MYACILAGGRGTRMRELTEALPKPLLPVSGAPILHHIIHALPAHVTHVVLVTGYLGEKVRAVIGTAYAGKSISYAPLEKLGGTAHALFEAKRMLPHGKSFLVLNGDDLYYPEDLARLARHPLAFGVKPLTRPAVRYLHVEASLEGLMTNLRKPREEETVVNVATGAYVLDHRIFTYEPVRIGSGELGLPHTVARMARDIPVFVEHMNYWFPLTSPEDVKNAEEHLRVHPLPTS